uniref:Dysbindin domain-containing protein 1 n=1 Tax=Anser cygnoides TaxID=8845 RepID=A0A8B9DG68_ANSCY|nr:dysbindin domain-containing protein 1 [Anser cygnoides]
MGWWRGAAPSLPRGWGRVRTGLLLDEERGGDPVSLLEGRWWHRWAPRPGQGTGQLLSGQAHGLPAALCAQHRSQMSLKFPEIPPFLCCLLWVVVVGGFCPLPRHAATSRGGGGGDPPIPTSPSPCPVPSHLAANRWRGPVARGWLCAPAAVTPGGLGAVGATAVPGATPRTGGGLLAVLGASPAPAAPPPQGGRPARTVPCLPVPPQETKRLLSGLRPPNRLRFCLADTKGLRGAGGVCRHRGWRGPRQLPRSAACSAGVPGLGTHSPLGRGAPGRRRGRGRELPSLPRPRTNVAGAGSAELGKETPAPERTAGTPVPGTAEEAPDVPVEEQGGIPIPTASLLQVTERRQPLSSVSSLEVHFDLLDLTELTDMSDQELAEVFADSDEENAAGESPSGLHPQAMPRAGYLRSPSWTRAREQGREKKHLSDSELQPGAVDAFLAVERPQQE